MHRRVTIVLNSKPVVDYEAPPDAPTQGAFALHLEAGVVEYRRIEVQELPAGK
jgi:hypothetical protein